MKRLVWILLCVLLLTTQLCPANAATAEEPVTLKVFFTGAISGSGTPSGIQTDPVAMDILDKIGVQLDFHPETTTEAFLLMLAGGDLPDLVMIEDQKFIGQMIRGNLIQPMDELLDQYGADILKNAPEKVEFSRAQFSDGTDKLYYLPVASGPGMVNDTYTFGLNVRWDLYKQLGYPEIKTYTDIIDIVEKMLALEPVNENGQKNYGFSFNSDWDGMTALYTLMLAPLYGYDTTEHDFHAEINDAEGYAVEDIFREDSWMFKGAEFLFEMNQRGLLDTDSMSQTWDNVSEKIKAGRVMLSFVYWPLPSYNDLQVSAGNPLKGYMPLYPQDSTTMWQFGDEPYGLTSGWVISRNCQRPDKAMQFLNYIHSIDGATTIFSGVEGTHWSLQDGVPSMTESTYQEKLSDPNFAMVTGVGKYYNASGLNAWTINPRFNESLQYLSWQTTRERFYSDLWKDYDAHFGVDAPYQAYDLQRTKDVRSDPYRAFMGVMPDEIAVINQRISDMARTEMYKMIFAADRSEFDAVKQDIIRTANELGLQQELDWVREERAKAQKLYEEYAK